MGGYSDMQWTMVLKDIMLITFSSPRAQPEVPYSFQYQLMPLYPPINVIFSLRYVVLLTAH